MFGSICLEQHFKTKPFLQDVLICNDYCISNYLKGQDDMLPGKMFITCWDYREVWLSYWSSYCGATVIFIALLIR